MHEPDARDVPRVSGWAAAGIVFAGVLMILVGIFQAMTGLAAIIDPDFFRVTTRYAYDLDATAWGWIHLVMGVAVTGAGLALQARRAWAGVVAIVLAMLSAIANFLTVPYYPFWSLLMIGLAVWVIWALTRPGAVRV